MINSLEVMTQLNLYLYVIAQPGYTQVPAIKLSIHALLIMILVSGFIGFYAGVRISRPRYWD